MKKLIVLVAALGALVLPSAAFAHTAALTGITGCANGKPNVTWKLVASDLARDPKVTETTNPAIPVGAGPGTFVQETALAATATVTVRWSNNVTRTVAASTPKPDACPKPPDICPIPPPSIVYIDRPVDRIVYVDKVVEKIVEKVIEVKVPVEKVVVVTKVKRIVKWKTRTVEKWRTRYVPCKASDNWDPITRACTPKTPAG